MKAYYCSSDVGSVLVGNEKFRICLPNIGGDGETRLLIFDTRKEFEDSSYPEYFKYTTHIEGNFNVYNYDCSRGDEKDILLELCGKYGVYRGNYTVALVAENVL